MGHLRRRRSAGSITVKLLLAKSYSEDANRLARRLIELGHEVVSVYDGRIAVEVSANCVFDAAIVDHYLPSRSGLDVCKAITGHQRMCRPVVMLASQSGLSTRLASFHAGADDHLDYPFAIEELAARLRAICREAIRHDVIRVGDLEVHVSELKIYFKNRFLDLQLAPFNILKILAERSPKVVNSKELTGLDGMPSEQASRAVAKHIYKLRMLIDKPYGRNTILTHRSVGYRLITD